MLCLKKNLKKKRQNYQRGNGSGNSLEKASLLRFFLLRGEC